MAFTFEYIGLHSPQAKSVNRWVSLELAQWNLLGRLSEGKVSLGDSVYLPTASGIPFRGFVARYSENLFDWTGLPFYDYVTPEIMPGGFCLCVAGEPGEYDILCPGIARSA